MKRQSPVEGPAVVRNGASLLKLTKLCKFRVLDLAGAL
jgi:hypothetical protein